MGIDTIPGSLWLLIRGSFGCSLALAGILLLLLGLGLSSGLLFDLCDRIKVRVEGLKL